MLDRFPGLCRALGWGALGVLGCSSASPALSKPTRSASVEIPAPGATAGRADEEPPASADVVPLEQPQQGRGWLGVELRAAAEGGGVEIANVVRNAPAARAGLAAGDVLLQIDGQPVNAPEDVVARVGQHRAGERVNLAYRRGADHHLAAAELEVMPDRDDILRKSYVGAEAPALGPIKTVQGAAPSTMNALRGKVVVLEFWASWCTVCPILVPTMNDWYSRYGAQGVEVIGVTTDPMAKASSTAGQLGMRYPIWADESGETTEAYRALAIPTVFVIDKAGIVRDVMVGYSSARVAELESLVGRLIAQP